MIKTRKGVSPVIAVLLLIAIAVATGILVYVWVTGLAGTLQQSGGQQVTEQVELLAYDWSSTDTLTLHLKNTGGIDVVIEKVYIDGEDVSSSVTEPGEFSSSGLTLSVGSTNHIKITNLTGYTAGTSHIVKIVTKTGGVFTFTVVAGRSG